MDTSTNISLDLDESAPGFLSNINALKDQGLVPIDFSAISRRVQRCVEEDRGGPYTGFYFSVPAEDGE